MTRDEQRRSLQARIVLLRELLAEEKSPLRRRLCEEQIRLCEATLAELEKD